MKKVPTLSSRFCCIGISNRLSFLFILLVFFSGFLYAQSNEDCLICHSDEDLTMEKNGREISLYVSESEYKVSSHALIKCVDCHRGYDAEDLPHTEGSTIVNCQSCHETLAESHVFHPGVTDVRSVSLDRSLSCVYCHGDHDVQMTKSKRFRFHSLNQNEACGTCHQEYAESYSSSIHYASLEQGLKGAPSCTDCHNKKITGGWAEEEGGNLRLEQVSVCMSCHLDSPETLEKVDTSIALIGSYETSIHGRAFLDGNENVVSCVGCHGDHSIAAVSDTASGVFDANIFETCEMCHAEEEADVLASVHGKALEENNPDAPVCDDCHSEHLIYGEDSPNTLIYFKNTAAHSCEKCHDPVVITEEFDITAVENRTFQVSYHGFAFDGAQTTASNCGSCHGYHKVLPSDNQESIIHTDNIVDNCARCHPGRHDIAAIGSFHQVVDETLKEEASPWYITMYIILIVFFVVVMLIHNLADCMKKGTLRRMRQRGEIEYPSTPAKEYEWMNIVERGQHILILLSFSVLTVSGFMISFPGSWWVGVIRDIWDTLFLERLAIHLVSAIIFLIAVFAHIVYVLVDKRGRAFLKGMMPGPRDIGSFFGVLFYSIGMSKEKPLLGRYTYVEKFNYWMFIIGFIVLTVTGFILWFGDPASDNFKAASILHYLQTWLSFLIVIIWHMYAVVMNPTVYPMNRAWLTGKLGGEAVADDHPAMISGDNDEEDDAQEDEKE